MLLFKTRVKALSSGWWLAILIICFSINNSQTAVIKKREAANESGNFVLDTTAAQPTILTALNNASEVVSTTKLQSVEGMNFASKETSKELTNNEILINEAKKLLEEEDKIINLNNQEEMKEKEKTEESVKDVEEENVLMKNHTETHDNLQDIKEIIKQLETKEQNLEEATKTSTEFSSNDIKIDKIPKLKEQTLQQEEDAKDQGEIEAKSYENSLKFEHEKPQPPSRILTELRTESTTKKSKILESHGENSIENSRELNKNVLVEEFKDKSAVIDNNNNESQLKVKLMPLETSNISNTQEAVKEIVTSNSLDNSKNQEDSKSLESVETTTVKMFIETSASVAEVTESWEVLEKTTLTPFIGEEKPKEQLTNTIQDGIDREVLVKTNELPQINTTNTENTTSETLKNEPDLLIFEGDKKEYARSMFKEEEEEETTTSNLQENKEDFVAITTFRPTINLHKEQEVGEANVKQQTENVSVNLKGKTAKFINDNSTNAQQLNLPNNAEVWSLAAMKSLPKANVSLETAPAHNHSQEFKENLLQLHNSSLTMSSNSEKNLLDWSQIMMDKELSTTTRNEEKEMEKEREENHLDTDERIKQSITTTSKPFEETTTQLKLQVRVEEEEVTLAPETISVTTLETILSQANDKNNNETDKNHEIDKKIEENMNNHLEMLTETLDVTTKTTTTANNNSALVDNYPMNATMNIEPNLNEINLTLKQKDLNTNDDSTTAAGNIKNLDMETTTAETLASTTEATAVVADITTTVEQISSETTTVSTLETSKQNASLNNDAIQKITETTITTNNNNNYNNVNLNETNSTTQTTTVTVSTALHEELENNENVTAKNQYINIETTTTTTVLPITTFRPNILAITSSTTTSTKAPNFEQEVDQNGNEIQTNLTTNNEPQQKQSITTTTTKVELDDNNSTKTIETHLAESREFETTTILAAKSTETENTLKSSIETTTSSSKDVNNLETTTPKLEDETTIGSSAPVATNEELERKEIETETATTTTETTSTTETNKTPVVVLETKPSENLASTTTTATTISSTEENIIATTTAKQEKEVLTSQEKDANIETTTNSSNMTTTSTIFSTTTTTMPVTAAKDEETYISLLDDTTTQSYSPTTISTATTTTTSPTPTPLASSTTTTTTTTTTSTLPSAITTKVEEIYNVIHSTTTELIQTTTQQLLTETEEESSTSSSTTTTTYDSSSTLYFTEMIPDTTTPSTKIIETADIGKSLPTLTSIMGGNSGNMYPKNSEASGETDVNVIIAITVSVIGVIALILLVGFLYLMRKRQKQNSYPNRCRPVSMDEFTIDNASIGGSMRKSSALRSSKRTYGNLAFDDPSLRHNPMGVHELAKFAQEKLRIFEEFRDVPQITSRLDEVPPGCEDKNRYANVLPLPETRVILQRLNDDEKTEYINANYVTGPKDAPNYYIACQAPLESTVEDFWRMIWEQQSRVIIQATDLIENGVEKCAEYLPPSVTLDNHSSFGDFQITLQNREVKDKYAISTILLKNVNENASRELTHYWYKWPEVGVPAEEAPIIAMLLEARSSLISYAIEQANEDKEKSSMATLKSAEEGTVSNNGSTMSPNSNGSSANGSTGEINGNISMVPIKKTASPTNAVLDFDDEEGPYQGKYLGKINSYHHQVSGDIYAVNEFTFLVVGFNYDGNGADTFFWAGASNRPGPQGFIVPDEYGKTNILDRYHNKDFTLTLPDRKKITEIKWLSVYDLNNQNNFGDVYIPEEFEPPRPQAGGTFSKRSHNVSSTAIEILDSKTIQIIDFTYDGKGKRTFFWAGVGAQPSSRGSKIPDERGYLDPIRKYDKETITLELPGDKTVFDIDWISIYDLADNENYGHVLIADNLNVPPSLVKITPYEFSLPNCRQLHKNLQVSWEVFGPQITLQLSGQVEKNDYMSFGLSGSDTSSQMIGGDVVVAYMDDIRGYSIDYNITSLAPCVQVLGQNKGVCRDDVVGGLNDFQLNTYSRKDGINTITFRRTLKSSDHGDKEIRLDRSNYIIWALGQLDSNYEPAFHNYYPKSDVLIDFNTTEPVNDCFSFTKHADTPIQTWEKVKILDPTVRTFNSYLGPSGGLKGYQGITGHVSSGLAWYINGYMIPELYLKRGLTYAFKVRGGNNPHSPDNYHPLVITDEPRGGYDRLSDAKQSEIRVLAGVEFTRRGRPKPTAAGPLCISRYPAGYDRRLDDNFPSFKKFNRSLVTECPYEEPAILEITPNITWPDIVYYNSFTHANMGWKIHIIDSYSNVRNHANKMFVGNWNFLMGVFIIITIFHFRF